MRCRTLRLADCLAAAGVRGPGAEAITCSARAVPCSTDSGRSAPIRLEDSASACTATSASSASSTPARTSCSSASEPIRPPRSGRSESSATRCATSPPTLVSLHRTGPGQIPALARDLGVDPAVSAAASRFWRRWVAAIYLRSYLATAAGAPFLPADRDEVERLLDLFAIERALVEVDSGL